MHELVVPRSMPMVFAIVLLLLWLSPYSAKNLSGTVADPASRRAFLTRRTSHVMPFKLLSDGTLERINRAVISGRIIPYLVAVMFTVGAAGTAAVRILSPNSFQSLGDAAWWSATTVTTIGYGDVGRERMAAGSSPCS